MAEDAQANERDWTHQGIDATAYAALVQGLATSELTSLLLGVIDQRASKRTPAQIGQQWQRDRFVAPAAVDQRTFNVLDSHLLSVASTFESLELSPLAPLASCSAIAL